jgi:hypothetical protein
MTNLITKERLLRATKILDGLVSKPRSPVTDTLSDLKELGQFFNDAAASTSGKNRALVYFNQRPTILAQGTKEELKADPLGYAVKYGLGFRGPKTGTNGAFRLYRMEGERGFPTGQPNWRTAPATEKTIGIANDGERRPFIFTPDTGIINQFHLNQQGRPGAQLNGYEVPTQPENYRQVLTDSLRP